jgi:hypothetical protein
VQKDGFEWALVAVYGAAQDANKPDFLAELVRICESELLPMMVGSDFNVIRRQEEKNNANFNPRWPFIFNAIIESLDLRELALSGRQFTWASRRTTPTFEKLDRVLVSMEWEEKYPLVSVRALTRTGSDYTPLLIETGNPAHLGRYRHFSFELSWLKQEGFFDMIKDLWESSNMGFTPIERWQNKIRTIRQYLRGWARDQSGKYKIEKEYLLKIIDDLDIKAESVPLSEPERVTMREAEVKLEVLHRDEEAKWAQRAKVKYIQRGGNNTKYFHLIANGIHRKKNFFQLEQDEGTIVGEANLKDFISEYYKKLFGEPEHNYFSWREDTNDDIPQLSEEESNILIANFDLEEVKSTHASILVDSVGPPSTEVCRTAASFP